MLENFIPLIASFLKSGIMQYCIFPIFGVAFVAFVPRLLHYLMHRG